MITNQYKRTQQFNSITKELIINKNNLIIIHINIRSLTQNLDKLREFIDKLDKYGIRGIPLKLIKNYLHNRTQLIKVNITESDIITNDIGVPQGSILGPLGPTIHNVCQ